MDIKNQKGQSIIEAVLLIFVAVTLMATLSNFLKGKEFAKKLVSGPWKNISGMVQCGVWKPCGIGNENTADHPSNIRRNRSWRKE